MSKWHFIFLSICFCFLTCSLEGAGKSEKKNSRSKKPMPYSFHIPKKWECIEDQKQLPEKVRVVFLGTGKTQFTPSINLATEETALELDEYFSLAKSYHESQGGTRCYTLPPLETKSGEGKVLQIDRDSQWGPIRHLQTSLIQEGTAYIITATCLQEEYASLYPIFLQAMQSFTIPQKNELFSN